jgi:hypothetical protein
MTVLENLEKVLLHPEKKIVSVVIVTAPSLYPNARHVTRPARWITIVILHSNLSKIKCEHCTLYGTVNRSTDGL